MPVAVISRTPVPVKVKEAVSPTVLVRVSVPEAADESATWLQEPV